MEVRNRLADVAKLRSNICQDFLKMIATSNWQQRLYDKAKYEVENNIRFKDKYISAYGKMRDWGIDQFTIDDMDVSLIVEVLHSMKDVFPAETSTVRAITNIRVDRNTKGHSTENEDAEELYLQGLLDLCNLRTFVSTVDQFERTIDDGVRLAFRRKYIPLIERLKETLDKERIQFVHSAKEIEQYIETILNSENPGRTWCDVSKIYLDRAFVYEKKPEVFYEFVVKASDAGIVQAHGQAADYYLTVHKDHDEAERRINMLLSAFEILPIPSTANVLSTINDFIRQGGRLTSGLESIIDKLREQGHNIKVSQAGFFILERKPKA